MPSEKNSRKLRDILKEAGKDGKDADSGEVNAAMGRNMAFFMPVMIFVLTIGFAAALSLYWFVGGLIAFIQQSRLLKCDEYDMQDATAVVVSKKTLKPSNEQTTKKSKSSSKKKKSGKNNKRRR